MKKQLSEEQQKSLYTGIGVVITIIILMFCITFMAGLIWLLTLIY